MNTFSKSITNRVPEWQSKKMKSLIGERWLEVWKVVVNRKRLEHLRQH